MEPLPLCAVFRANGHEVGRELDLTVFQVHGIAEIDDALVMRIGNRQREVDATGDALVGSRVPELLAIEDFGAGGDVDTKNPGLERDNGGHCQEQKQCGKSTTELHARKDSMPL